MPIGCRGASFLDSSNVALHFALLVAARLLINGFPHTQGDAQAGKHSAVVWVDPTAARSIYLGLVVGAHLRLATRFWVLIPPQQALWGLVAAPLVLAVLLHGLGLSAGFLQLASGR